MKPQIILASASPRRKELLKRIVNNFKIVESGVDEEVIKGGTPLAFAKKAAIAKAKTVAAQYPKATVIGADTIVVLGKKILGKPKDNNEAIVMLKSLAGRTHKVITGLAVVSPGGKIIAATDTTKVKMKKVTDKEILDYVSSGRPLDKAGGYGIQEIEEIFIDKIDGDYDNVVGLPVYKLKRLLKLI